MSHKKQKQEEEMTSGNDTEKCAECQEYLEGWKRAKADYANLQHEMEKERSRLRKYANEDLLAKILPAIDQYSVAMNYAPDFSKLPDDAKKTFENWMVGLGAVRDIWERAFESAGLQKVREEGEFDPEIHEAVQEEESADVPAGNIIRTQESGWMLHDKLIRPAKVTISSPPKEKS